MTEYCDCGRAAGMLCRVCRIPTCQYHRFARRNLCLGTDVYADAECETWLGDGLCNSCLPAQCDQELESNVLPQIRVGGANSFERACAVATAQEYRFQDRLSARLGELSPRPVLVWRLVNWRGPMDKGLPAKEFARQFADAAARRKLKPQEIRISVFRRRQVYAVLGSYDDRGRPRKPWYFVTTDGVQMYEVLTVDQYRAVDPATVVDIYEGVGVTLDLSVLAEHHFSPYE